MIVCKPVSFRVRMVFGIIAIGLVAIGYKLLTDHQHEINPRDTTVPNFTQMVAGFKMMFQTETNGHYWIVSDAIATGERLLVGLSVGVLLSIFVGMLIGCFHILAAVLAPPLTFVSKIPPTAILAVFFILCGTNFELFVVFIGFGIFPQMVLSIYSSVNNDVQTDAIYKAYTLGASHLEVIYEVIWKQVLPRFLQNIQSCIGPAMVFLIAAEWMVADQGFGYRLRIQSRLLNMNLVYVYLLILGAAGWTVDYILIELRRRLCRWFGE